MLELGRVAKVTSSNPLLLHVRKPRPETVVATQAHVVEEVGLEDCVSIVFTSALSSHFYTSACVYYI